MHWMTSGNIPLKLYFQYLLTVGKVLKGPSRIGDKACKFSRIISEIFTTVGKDTLLSNAIHRPHQKDSHRETRMLQNIMKMNDW